jgi:hypothetical protein
MSQWLAASRGKPFPPIDLISGETLSSVRLYHTAQQAPGGIDGRYGQPVDFLGVSDLAMHFRDVVGVWIATDHTDMRCGMNQSACPGSLSVPRKEGLAEQDSPLPRTTAFGGLLTSVGNGKGRASHQIGDGLGSATAACGCRR